jgi:hypothetical protein
VRNLQIAQLVSIWFPLSCRCNLVVAVSDFIFEVVLVLLGLLLERVLALTADRRCVRNGIAPLVGFFLDCFMLSLEEGRVALVS